MKKLNALSSALALGMTVAACDGPKENAAEDAGEQAAEATNASAEAAADAGQITDAQASAMTDQAENKADAMEKQGEEADKTGAPGPAATATTN